MYVCVCVFPFFPLVGGKGSVIGNTQDLNSTIRENNLSFISTKHTLVIRLEL